ncbi:iron-sulfur cluster carrier protein [Paenibacillus sp. J31TS4]|uniref:Mrp/NBP35 family ATP-binding protein n=1 Tax=Paenibacillus sp. J31TS4 TaxID=2807195 RepID=UPI001B2F6260|nr:Mrp/NBP35 family ATP-binding protein [Paenibacillus sp. J31TS4]GIP41462.1 iron-sulfur cluster carrier protein [Paenibacillus sp. J31TS4]
MVTRDEVRDALKHIHDPAFHKPITDLQFVKDIMVKENQVALTLLLSEDKEELRGQYRQDVKEALGALGIPDVHIRFRMASEHEREEAGKAVASASGAPQDKPQTTHAPKQGQAPLLSAESRVKFIAVASGKGGVGKSTVTVNLAVALARRGKKVGIIDADIYGFSVPDMMGIEERPQLVNERIIPVERFGVQVISMGFFVEDNAPIIWRGPMLGKMLRNFFSEVEWGELDYLLLDLPPGTGDVALDVHQMIPQSKEIIVTTPHATAAFVAARAGAMALHTNHEILGIVENMSYYQTRDGEKDYVFGRGGGAKLAEELHTELLAQIPLRAPENHIAEPDFSPSVYKEDTETGRMYLEVADRVIDKLS